MNETPKPLAVISNQLADRRDEFKQVLPGHIPPERFIAVVKTALVDNPNLLAADRASLFRACRHCAQDGLLPDGHEAVLIPFKNHVQYIPMVYGLLKLFRNSGQFKHVNTGIVYQGEPFEHWIDENGEHFKHVPGDNRDPAAVRRVYATATTKDGGFFIVDMTLAELNKHKAMSRASREDAPWRQWEQAMQRKTALRVLSKLLPKSSDLEAVMREDEAELYGDERVEVRRISDQPFDTKSALDTFGAADSVTDTPSPAVPEEGGTDSAPEGANASNAEMSAADNSDRPADSVATPDEQMAYARGIADRKRGALKKALPGEYRASNRLAIAWTRGWDEGKQP